MTYVRKPNDRLHRCYYAMRTRCYNPKAENYHKYGGRGIGICEEWRNSFAAFRDWALANGFSEELQIDRIDPRRDYSPGNCRWVSAFQNAGVTSKCIMVTAFGQTKHVAEWSRDPKCAVTYSALLDRIEHGWTPERAIVQPSRKLRQPA